MPAVKGSGSVRKKTVRRAGKLYTYWEARVTEGRCPLTGKQIQRSFTGATKEEATQKKEAYESSLPRTTVKSTEAEGDIFAPEYITRFFQISEEAQPGAYVYFISDGFAVKVGASANPYERAAVLQTGNPRTLDVLFTVPFRDLAAATKAEEKYHSIFRNYWLRGEWFAILPRVDVKAWRSYWAHEATRKDE